MTYINNITEIKDLRFNDDGKTMHMCLVANMGDYTSNETFDGIMILPKFQIDSNGIISLLTSPDGTLFEIRINKFKDFHSS